MNSLTAWLFVAVRLEPFERSKSHANVLQYPKNFMSTITGSESLTHTFWDISRYHFEA